MTSKLILSDGQRDTDSVLAIEVPVGCERQQRNGSKNNSNDPSYQACNMSRNLAKVSLTVGKTKD